MQETGEKIPENKDSDGLPALARDPAVLYKIKLDLDKRIAGEDKNKLTVLVEANTVFSKDPQGAVITGASSAGKSHLLNQTLGYFKKLGLVKDYTRITGASPDRLQGNFSGKILVVQEIGGIEAAQSKIRVWISEGGLHLLTTEREEKTGKIKTAEMHTTGIPVFFTTTTSVQPDQELLNRLMILSMDESEAQTDKVLDFIVEDVSTPNPLTERKPDEEIVAFFAESFGSKQVADRVLIPYAADLKKIFAHKKVEARRDFRKLCRLIWSVAFIHQHQRMIVAQKEKMPAAEKTAIGRFIVALPVDFYMAWAIADQTMRQTLLGLQDRAIRALRCFQPSKAMTARDIAAAMDVGQDLARGLLKVLESRGFVLCDESTKPYQYSLVRGEEKDETSRISNVLDDLSEFGKEKLDSWLNDNGLVCVLDIPDLPLDPSEAFVDPITGQVWSILNGENTHEKYPLLTRKTVSSENRAETSRSDDNRLGQRPLLWLLDLGEGA